MIGLAIQNIMIAQSASHDSSSSLEAIKAATRSNNRFFAVYVFVLLLGMLITILLFRSGNKVQEAIRADADARIKGSDERIKEVESSAKVRIKQIEDDAVNAKRESDEKIALLNSAAKASVVKQQELALATEELRRENNEAAEKLEAEKRKRIELAVSLLPRKFRDQSGAETRLKALPRMTALIEYLDTPECLSTAEQINFVLRRNDWSTSGVRTEIAWPENGVTIFVPGPRVTTQDPTEASKSFGRWQAALAVAEALVEELNRSGINAVDRPGDSRIAEGTLLIRVGIPPNSALENTLTELGPPEPATPLPGTNIRIGGGNRQSFK